MTIEKITEGALAVWKLQGWLDTKSAPAMAAALRELPPETEALTLDLAEVSYVSSAGVRQLVAAHKQVNGNLRLQNLGSEVLNVLRMMGLDRRLHIES